MKRLLLLLLIPLIFQGCFRASHYYVGTPSTQMLEQPESGSRVIADIPKDTKVYATKKQNMHYRVTHDGKTGYVSQAHMIDPVQYAQWQATLAAPKPSGPAAPSSPAIMTGPKGGKYYINKNGNKTYVKKK